MKIDLPAWVPWFSVLLDCSRPAYVLTVGVKGVGRHRQTVYGFQIIWRDDYAPPTARCAVRSAKDGIAITAAVAGNFGVSILRMEPPAGVGEELDSLQDEEGEV